MFSSRNKKDISIFRMKKAPYLLLCNSGPFNLAVKKVNLRLPLEQSIPVALYHDIASKHYMYWKKFFDFLNGY